MELGLIVDQPKPGFGSSNDGNTARRFLKNASISAAITGVDEALIKRFHVILQTISCGHEIDFIKFQDTDCSLPCAVISVVLHANFGT